jgi:hypothetical protein
MLTGPVTIVAWSFVRDDLPLPAVVHQVADAIRGEVADLEAAGIPIIQVDEPALRELLPLRAADQEDYLAWAVAAYRHATSGAGDATQIHTHLCYSDAAQVLAAIDGLDADVTSIESARSHGRILDAVRGFGRGLGPGVYDIHSPRVPPEDEVLASLTRARESVGAERLWVNPDCGLKTRGYAEVTAALTNLVSAAGRVRAPVTAASTRPYPTGNARASTSGSRADQPMSCRPRRRRTARRISSAATRGSMVSSLRHASSPAARSSSLTPAPVRAFSAMRVRIPPGWTTVTPTASSASSWRSASVNPRTANLLAA